MQPSQFKKLIIILALLTVIMFLISWTRHLAFVPMVVIMIILLIKIRNDRRDL